MDITKFIVTQRNKSLLVGDYGLYRKQLSRRLLIVRRRLGRTSANGRKYVAKAPITAEDISSNHDFVHLLLLTSERAWAHAMYMKSMHSADSAAKPITGSTRKHILSRLHKAEESAAFLTELLSTDIKEASRHTILEAGAYRSSLRGSLNFESAKWEKCLQSYSEVHVIYTELAKSSRSGSNDLFRDLLSNTIDPSIRYAAYQLRLPRTLSIRSIVLRFIDRTSKHIPEILKSNPDALSEDVAGTKREPNDEARDLPKTINWRSRTVKLEDASIAQALATVSSAEQKLTSLLSSEPEMAKDRASTYDEILISSQDAVDATKTAIDELTADGVAQSDQRMQALQITRTAVNYALVGWRIGRNRILCGSQDGAALEAESAKKSKKPRTDGKEWVVREEGSGRKLARLRERVVLYDSTLQSLDSIKELPGVAGDQSFVQELDSKRLYFAALRCLAIARSHDLTGNPKNSLALLARAASLSSQANSTVSFPDHGTEKPPNLDVTAKQIQSLRHLLKGLVAQHRALVEIHNLDADVNQASKATAKSYVPLLERLEEYPSSGVDLGNLVTYPPQLTPIPIKPLFLDVAWNYIEYPGRGTSVTAAGSNGIVDSTKKQVEAKGEGRKGWFGFGR